MHVGSVYTYLSVGNVWSCQSKILAADGAATDLFGATVDIYGTLALIGAFYDDDKAADAGIINIISYIIFVTISEIYKCRKCIYLCFSGKFMVTSI
jgi:hypothetical protein